MSCSSFFNSAANWEYFFSHICHDRRLCTPDHPTYTHDQLLVAPTQRLQIQSNISVWICSHSVTSASAMSGMEVRYVCSISKAFSDVEQETRVPPSLTMSSWVFLPTFVCWNRKVNMQICSWLFCVQGRTTYRCNGGVFTYFWLYSVTFPYSSL